jgi:hypothetical protein
LLFPYFTLLALEYSTAPAAVCPQRLSRLSKRILEVISSIALICGFLALSAFVFSAVSALLLYRHLHIIGDRDGKADNRRQAGQAPVNRLRIERLEHEKILKL